MSHLEFVWSRQRHSRWVDPLAASGSAPWGLARAAQTCSALQDIALRLSCLVAILLPKPPSTGQGEQRREPHRELIVNFRFVTKGLCFFGGQGSACLYPISGCPEGSLSTCKFSDEGGVDCVSSFWWGYFGAPMKAIPGAPVRYVLSSNMIVLEFGELGGLKSAIILLCFSLGKIFLFFSFERRS